MADPAWDRLKTWQSINLHQSVHQLLLAAQPT
jgi:hypothetical protein